MLGKLLLLNYFTNSFSNSIFSRHCVLYMYSVHDCHHGLPLHAYSQLFTNQHIYVYPYP